MDIRSAMEEALHRGEKIKNQLLKEVLKSSAAQELFQNEFFLKSLGKVLNTQYELKEVFKSNFKHLLKAVNLPTREEVSVMERKIHRLENEIEGMHRKVMTRRLAKVSKARASTHKASKALKAKAKK